MWLTEGKRVYPDAWKILEKWKAQGREKKPNIKYFHAGMMDPQ